MRRSIKRSLRRCISSPIRIDRKSSGASRLVWASRTRTSSVSRKAPAPAKRGPGRPRKAGKRRPGRPARQSPEVVAKTAELVQAHVEAKPGQRMEEGISAALRRLTADLTAATTALLAEGKVRREGQRRGTRYFPGSGRAVAAKPAGRKTGRRNTRNTAKRA
jgi:hypothetical protein